LQAEREQLEQIAAEKARKEAQEAEAAR
jgi:fused signal recognition particle receptor